MIDIISQWVFGTKVKTQPVPENIRKKLNEKFEKILGEYSFSENDNSQFLLHSILSEIPESEIGRIPKILVQDALLELVDARSARLPDVCLVGIDRRLYILIYNAAVLLFSTCTLAVPPILKPHAAGKAIYDVADAVGKEIDDAIHDSQGHSDETILPDVDTLRLCTQFVFWAESFVLLHEIGHLVLAQAMSSCVGINSLFHSLNSDFAGLGEINATKCQKEPLFSWIDEILADRYAFKMLKIALVSKYENFGLFFCYFVMSFIFHLLDNFVRTVIINTGNAESFLNHPPPFFRLQFCGVPYEYMDPHAFANEVEEPFQTVVAVFDGLGKQLLLGLAAKMQTTDYVEWVLNSYKSIMDKIEFIEKSVLKVEETYYTRQ